MTRRTHLQIVSSGQPLAGGSISTNDSKGGNSSAVGQGARPPQGRQRINATQVPPDWQLPLPFGENRPSTTILIVPTEFMNGPALRSIISERRPRSVVDLREMIRFDLPGTSRDDVFRTMRLYNTFYVSDPLPWHRLDAKAFAMLQGPISSVLFHEIVERKSECVLVFVFRHDESRLIVAHLNKILSEQMRVPYSIVEAY